MKSANRLGFPPPLFRPSPMRTVIAHHERLANAGSSGALVWHLLLIINYNIKWSIGYGYIQFIIRDINRNGPQHLFYSDYRHF